jgi:hypothetical protein
MLNCGAIVLSLDCRGDTESRTKRVIDGKAEMLGVDGIFDLNALFRRVH